MPLDPHPEAILPQFNLSAFRPGQREVISAVMTGNDCLCIMPTGGGKSLCYQLPAVAREGLTIVVSPLIALMKDQVDQLTARGISATYINSSLTAAEQSQRLEQLSAGKFRLVYIAPERLRNSRFQDAIRTIKVEFLAVDEAHCISEWGHDFRPDYSRLGKFRRRLGFPQTIALTATATPNVRDDVIRQLELRAPRVFISGFARRNLHFEVWDAHGGNEKNALLLDFLRGQAGAGIIYAGTRKRCVELMELVGRETKRKIGFYHAGLTPDDRRRVQDEFMSGRTPWLVATNAFGMGVDKSDLRFVVHYDIPGSVEAYYQEAGRAGRDGAPSRCILLFSESDRYLREFFIENAYPPRLVVAKIYDYLRELADDPIELTQEQVKEQLGLACGNEAVSVSERLLEKCGVLERIESSENSGSVRISGDLPSLIDLVPVDAKVQRKVLKAVEKIVGDVRDDRVFFSPTRMATKLELEPAAMTRALRELNKLQAFDYVPPFRGRAIHMREREKPFEELAIDFAELDKRKAAEYAKLDEMIAYARNRGCRQVFVLDYFGDPDKAPCGLCDNCGGVTQGIAVTPVPAAAAAEEDDALVRVVRMALAGVARTKGRVGKHLIAKMLCGSQAKEVSRGGLNKLSTFGLFSGLAQPDVVEFLEELLRARLLEQVEAEKFRPTVQLSPLGESVMRQEKPLPASLKIEAALAARLKSIKPSKPEPPTTSLPARESEPDFPFPDDFEPSFSPPPEIFAASPSPPTSSPPKLRLDGGEVAVTPAARPDYYWTWRLMQQGFSAEECRAIRGIDESVFLQHLIRAAEEGLTVEPRWGLSPEQLDLCEQSEQEAEDLPMLQAAAQLGREHRRFFKATARNGRPGGFRGV